jgi:hypothetical protein
MEMKWGKQGRGGGSEEGIKMRKSEKKTPSINYFLAIRGKIQTRKTDCIGPPFGEKLTCFLVSNLI